MARTFAAFSLLAVALATGACHTAQPSPQRSARVRILAKGTPEEVLAKLRADVKSHGWKILDDGPSGLAVDFGEREMRIPVPTDYGLWGSRVSFRDTEVRGSAMYVVDSSDSGTVVTVWNNPIYWHPDLQTWLPGPYDVSPGAELLKSVSVQ